MVYTIIITFWVHYFLTYVIHARWYCKMLISSSTRIQPRRSKIYLFQWLFCRLLSLSWTMLLNAVVDQHAEWSVLNPGGSVLFLWVHCYLNFYFLSFFIKVWFILNIGCTLIVLNLFFTRLQRELLQRGMRNVVKMVVLDIRSDWKGLCICQ